MKLAVIATLFATVLASVPAYARPVDDKRAQAVKVKAQLDGLDKKLEVAAEDYNEADSAYREVTSKVRATQSKLTKLRGRIGTLQNRLDHRANAMYRSGPTQVVEMLLGAADFEQLASAWDLLEEMGRSDANAIADLKVARREAASAESQLKKQQAEAKSHLRVMADRKGRIERSIAERKGLLNGIESEIASLEAAEEAAARAAAARALASRRTPRVSRGGGGADYGTPTRAPRSQVVQIAMRYLGTPYQWGGSGPNTFDCSGFTAYVYRQVGVSLPHSSRAQFRSGERVSRANLQPGDLVFFGSPIHHVGIYVGGGRYIHAPRTGDVVKVSSLGRSDYAGAVRP